MSELSEPKKRRLVIEFDDYEGDKFSDADLKFIREELEANVLEQYDLAITSVKVEDVDG